MAPFLLPIISMFADKGLDLISSALDGGAEKAKDFIEEKTGITLKPKMSREELDALSKFEKEHSYDLAKLALEKLKEENRHEENLVQSENEDRTRATDMFKHASELQTKTANQVMWQTSLLIPSLIIALIYLFLNLDSLGKAEASSLTGVISAALMHLYNERKQLLGFLFGAMIAKIKRKGE